MESPALQVVLVQLAPTPRDVAANTAALLEILAAHPDADLVVAPELFLTGYTLAGVGDLALGPDDEPIELLRQAAARHRTALAVGYAERISGRERPGNSVLLLDDDGRVAGVYRKVHLFGAETDHFTAGEEYLVAHLLGRPTAALVCYDLEFPEPARAVALAGADLLVTVSANMEPYPGEHELFARARALENRLPHVYVNRVGRESGLTFVGGSCVVDAAGVVVADLERGPTVRQVAVPLDRVVTPDYLADRRDVTAVRTGRP